MSCVPCLECGDGAGLTRENLDRWTDSIANVLASPEGRHHFKKYLESRTLDESLYAVEFWERCTRAMPKRPDGGDSPPAETSTLSDRFMHTPGSSAGGSASLSTNFSPSLQKPQVSEDLRKDLHLLVDFADNYVNLDLAQLRCLHQILKTTDTNKVIEILAQAKQASVDLLADDYQLFKVHLLESRGFLNK